MNERLKSRNLLLMKLLKIFYLLGISGISHSVSFMITNLDFAWSLSNFKDLKGN